MADIVGTIASIVQLLHFGKAVFDRLEEYRSDLEGYPRAYKNMKAQLNLLLDSLRTIKDALNSGAIPETSAKALRPALHGCTTEVLLLKKIIMKVVPPPGTSRARRNLMAFASIRYDGQVERASKTLDSYTAQLTLHASTSKYIVPGGRQILHASKILSTICEAEAT